MSDDTKTPEVLAQEAASKLAAFHFPKSRHLRFALQSDIFLELQRFATRAYAAGLGDRVKELDLSLDPAQLRKVADIKFGQLYDALVEIGTRDHETEAKEHGGSRTSPCRTCIAERGLSGLVDFRDE